MGRYVTCGEDIVWKYRFGVQPSELYRIEEELGVGKHFLFATEIDRSSQDGFRRRLIEKGNVTEYDDIEGDLLVLRKSDLSDLERHVERLAKDEPEEDFTQMIRRIRDYLASATSDVVELKGEF